MGLHGIWTPTRPRFYIEHKNSLHAFEICLPAEDPGPLWMKQICQENNYYTVRFFHKPNKILFDSKASIQIEFF